MTYILQGLLLGLAYVAPIGMQNMYVINASIKNTRLQSIRIAMIVIFFDITLALACFFGIGMILSTLLWLKYLIIALGSLAIIYIGINLIRSETTVEADEQPTHTIMKTITTCFAVTWLNPQAIIDGSLLLGGFKASLTSLQGQQFIIGVILASTLWFLSLSLLISFFKHIMNHKHLKVINVICGIVLIGFGIKLGYSLF